MCHYLFKPQPVKHARAYCPYWVLHDWSLGNCVRIVEQLKPTLRPEYSTVLVNELIASDQNASWPITSINNLMLVLGAMKERTQADEADLSRAGLKIVHVYSYEMGSESLIEAELA